MQRKVFTKTEDFLEQNALLNLDLPFSQDLSVLGQPLQVGNKTIANRLACQAMEGCDGTSEGSPDELTIEHLGSTWVVTGKWLERLIININFDDYESRNYFDLQLRKCGLFKRLEDLGIQDGDVVDIYDMEFEYQR